MQTIGAADIVTYKKEKAREESLAKRAKYYESQVASTSNLRYHIQINHDLLGNCWGILKKGYTYYLSFMLKDFCNTPNLSYIM